MLECLRIFELVPLTVAVCRAMTATPCMPLSVDQRLEFFSAVPGPMRKAARAVKAVPGLKTTWHQGSEDCSSATGGLTNESHLVNVEEITQELNQLKDLLARVAGSISKYTAALEDGVVKHAVTKSDFFARHKVIRENLEEIDCEVMRYVEIMFLKGEFDKGAASPRFSLLGYAETKEGLNEAVLVDRPGPAPSSKASVATGGEAASLKTPTPVSLSVGHDWGFGIGNGVPACHGQIDSFPAGTEQKIGKRVFSWSIQPTTTLRLCARRRRDTSLL